MVNGERAWLAIAAGVVVYEALCPEGQLLSDACDRARARHPLLVHAAMAVTVAHLLRLLPARFDPYAYAPMVAVHIRVLPKYRKVVSA